MIERMTRSQRCSSRSYEVRRAAWWFGSSPRCPIKRLGRFRFISSTSCLESATAAGLASASRLASAAGRSARSFASANRLARSFAATSRSSAAVAAAVVTLEQLREEALDAIAASRLVAARIGYFATAGRSARCFATAGWLAGSFATADGFAAGSDFHTASGLAASGVTATAMTREEPCQQSSAAFVGAGIAARIRNFAAAGRCTSGLATACGFNVATAVTTVATQFVKQAERASVGRARSNHCDCHQSWNDYTTHREISMEIRFLGRFMPRLSRNTSERPKTSSKPWLNPITNDAWEVPQVDRRVAARAAQHLSHRCSQTAIVEATFPNAEIP